MTFNDIATNLCGESTPVNQHHIDKRVWALKWRCNCKCCVKTDPYARITHATSLLYANQRESHNQTRIFFALVSTPHVLLKIFDLSSSFFFKIKRTLRSFSWWIVRFETLQIISRTGSYSGLWIFFVANLITNLILSPSITNELKSCALPHQVRGLWMSLRIVRCVVKHHLIYWSIAHGLTAKVANGPSPKTTRELIFWTSQHVAPQMQSNSPPTRWQSRPRCVEGCSENLCRSIFL